MRRVGFIQRRGCLVGGGRARRRAGRKRIRCSRRSRPTFACETSGFIVRVRNSAQRESYGGARFIGRSVRPLRTKEKCIQARGGPVTSGLPAAVFYLIYESQSLRLRAEFDVQKEVRVHSYVCRVTQFEFNSAREARCAVSNLDAARRFDPASGHRAGHSRAR